MIHSLTGTVSGGDENTLLIKTEGGIEWMLQISTTTASALPRQGNEVRILTYLHHREDQMMLFGFGTAEERSVFFDLLKVSGIGTRQALRILSGMSVSELVRSLDSEDVDSLARVPGLGKKTAQKILLTLRGKLSLATERGEEPADEIVSALVEMGFDRSKAQSAIAAVRSEAETGGGTGSATGTGGELEEAELIKEAIVRLSASGRTT